MRIINPLLAVFLLSFLILSIPLVFGSSEDNWNWVEVERITGDTYNLYETEPFNISSSVSVWRIVWEYKPRIDVPEDKTGITINVYTGVSGDDTLIRISRTGIHNGNEQTRYFHEQGTFRLKISSNTQNFTVRVEKSMGYVPEPPSDNWVEVTRFIGTKGFTTSAFVCDHVEWRIVWEFDPGHWHFPDLYTLKVTTFKMLNQSGTFYMKIDSGLSDSYTIIVEQNTNSSPKPEDSWVEVTKFTGHGSLFGATSPFVIDHNEWRIRWEYVPLWVFGPQNDFTFFVVPEENRIEGVFTSGMSIAGVNSPVEKNGTLYFPDLNGTFYLHFAPGTSTWTVIVEQNLDSIPEFSSKTILVTGLLIITTISIIYRHKRKQENQK